MAETMLVRPLLTEPEHLLALTANSPSICILVERGAGTGVRMIVANHAGGASCASCRWSSLGLRFFWMVQRCGSVGCLVVDYSVLVLSSSPNPVCFSNIIVLGLLVSFAIVVVYPSGFVQNVHLVLHFVA